jgi:hypothetical protein
MTLIIGSKGYALLRNPHTNKGTAFSDEERRTMIYRSICSCQTCRREMRLFTTRY